MIRSNTLSRGIVAILLAGVAVPAAAQQMMPAPTPTADALAAQVRILGSDPRNVPALILAGELSTKLGDPAAALGFFARAQTLEPGNMRVIAGRAGALILLERPGEALQLYAQAERGGVAMEPYLAQRGLAYDLIGQNAHAQQDYRRALRGEPDDETVRRLALSLGISGKRDEAMTLLDPLLRRNDRAAWRARACILALSGDVVGAQTIATNMLSGGAALTPFFARLPALSAADRAFAVHFGQLAPTVARANDARLAPQVAALTPEPAPVPARPATVLADAGAARSEPVRTARNRRRELPPASLIPMTEPEVRRRSVPVEVARQPDADDRAIPARSRDTASSATVAAASRPIPEPSAAVSRAVAPVAIASAPPPPGVPVTAWAPTADSLPPRPSVAVPAVASPRVETMAVAPNPGVAPPPSSVAPASATVEIATLPAQRRVSAPPASETSPPEPAPPPAPVVASAPAPVVSAPPPAAPPVRTAETARRNTQVLASIIESIAVPASELDVAPVRPAASTRQAPAQEPEREPAEVETPRRPVAAARVVTEKPAVPKAEPRKPEAKKPEPKKPDPTKTEPERWWVQVAGGANAADLGKDWKRLIAKSPAAFRGRTAWTTPLRATNRLLAGPFKSMSEAMAFVNLLAKDGTSSFAWQSDAGQKVTRLGAK